MNNLSPIYLSVKDNIITINESSISEVMEMNSYPVIIDTNENLDGCELVIKKYGDLNLETVGALNVELKRLVKFVKDEVSYWGELTYNEEEKNYKAILNKYSVVKVPSGIPNKDKIEGYDIVEVGQIKGSFEYSSEKEDYIFSLEKIILNGEEISNENIGNIELIITKDLFDIPLPPNKDGKIKIPDTIFITGKLQQDEFIFEFEKVLLSFENYDEENGLYYYIKEIDISESTQELTLPENSEFLGKIKIGFQENNFGEYTLLLDGSLTSENKNYFIFIQDAVNFEIDYSNFDFEKEIIPKEEFFSNISISQSSNRYKVELSSEFLPSKLSKFLLGVRKLSGEKTTYITDGVEFFVVPSIENINWEGNKISTQEYILGTFDEENKIFKNLDEEKVLGEEGILYIEEGTEIKIYQWSPEIGFYKLKPVGASQI